MRAVLCRMVSLKGWKWCVMDMWRPSRWLVEQFLLGWLGTSFDGWGGARSNWKGVHKERKEERR